MSVAAVVENHRQVEFEETFGFGPEEKLLDSFSCALQSTIRLHGRLFVSENYFSFFSQVFGITIRWGKWSDVISIDKKRSGFVIPDAISLKCRWSEEQNDFPFVENEEDGSDGGDLTSSAELVASTGDSSVETLVFTSLFGRDVCYGLMMKTWHQSTDEGDGAVTIADDGATTATSLTGETATKELPSDIEDESVIDNDDEIGSKSTRKDNEEHGDDDDDDVSGSESVPSGLPPFVEEMKDGCAHFPSVDELEGMLAGKPNVSVQLPSNSVDNLWTKMLLLSEFWSNCQKKVKGCNIVEVQQWTVPHLKSSEATCQSLKSSESTCNICWQREVKIIADLFGFRATFASQAKVFQSHAVRRLGAHRLAIRVASVAPEMPYGDSFVVRQLIVFDCASADSVTLSVFWDVEFVKSILFLKRQIQSSVNDDCVLFYGHFVETMKHSLASIDILPSLPGKRSDSDSVVPFKPLPSVQHTQTANKVEADKLQYSSFSFWLIAICALILVVLVVRPSAKTEPSDQKDILEILLRIEKQLELLNRKL